MPRGYWTSAALVNGAGPETSDSRRGLVLDVASCHQSKLLAGRMFPILISLKTMLWRCFGARFFAVRSLRLLQDPHPTRRFHDFCFLPTQDQRLHPVNKPSAAHDQAFRPARFPPDLFSRERFGQARLQVLAHGSQIVCSKPPA